MKVAHVIASSGLYGAEKWIFALMLALENSSVKSTLVNLSDFKGEESAVVAAARVRGLDALDFYTGGAFNPLSIIRFSKWLRKNDIDIVHGHGYKSDLIGLSASKLAGCKVVSTPHGWSSGAGFKLMLYEWLDRVSFKFMDYVCPLSEDLLESVKKYTHPKKVRLILNGVDVSEIGMAIACLKMEECYLHVGYVGQLIKRKNIETLIKAFASFSAKHKNTRLSIVGDGPEKNKLTSLAYDLGILEKTEFLGYRKDALSILKSFDVFVLPSLLEGIPRCLMEAMVAEVTVVASDIPGCRHLVDHQKTGLLFPPLDEKALCDALDLLASDKIIMKNLSKNAHQLVLDKFSNQRMAKEYLELYSKILL